MDVLAEYTERYNKNTIVSCEKKIKYYKQVTQKFYGSLFNKS